MPVLDPHKVAEKIQPRRNWRRIDFTEQNAVEYTSRIAFESIGIHPLPELATARKPLQLRLSGKPVLLQSEPGFLHFRPAGRSAHTFGRETRLIR